MSLLALLCASAAAAPYGEVVALWQPDEEGRWARVERADEAWMERGDEIVSLEVGATPDASDRVVTQRARVQLRSVEHDREITIYEDSAVVLEEWGVLHELGAVLYEVRGAFEVHYYGAEALVEGTRFWVEGDGAGTGMVSVEEGRVRVRNESGAVLLGRRSAMASVAPGEVPAAPEGPAARAARTLHWERWRERRWQPLEVGTLLVTGVGQQTGEEEVGARLGVHGLARLDLPGRWELSYSGGLTNTPTTTQLPSGLGLARSHGLLSVGGRADLLLGWGIDCEAGSAFPVVRGGGSLTGALRVPLGSRTALETHAAAGWVDGPRAELGFGATRQL